MIITKITTIDDPMRPEQTKAEILADVRDMTQKHRDLFVTLLKQSIQTEDTVGSCLYAAFMCSTALGKFTKAQITIRGGDGEGDGGLFVDDVGHGHYWLEADIQGDKFIVDITADQFGLPPVIVERIEVMAQIYVPGDQQVVNDHVLEMMKEIAQGGQ